ncbi:Na(+)/H(+) exchange regulatory cofactor NHE-RF3-like [Octopus sinensis]|uniref:Na(+)/H(+) exchange regulatory cofactor NHE-RF3-like n=1 Tax=Octopus sinensis TaxID=2607531 RepID=A0A6P7U4B0_9MOLL|nr:Na(+)/H(+) exchange regulatory cofactor NHE-RF3-like [Octopus sinensis]
MSTVLITVKCSSSGFGFGVDTVSKSKKHFVSEIFPNSPASFTNLEINDIILEINNKNVQNKSHNYLAKQIKKSTGEILLLVKRFEVVEIEETKLSTNRAESISLPIDTKNYSPRICQIAIWNGEDLGIQIIKKDPENGFFIVNVDENSPADVAGIRNNDIILEIDSISVKNMNFEDVLQAIKINWGTVSILVADENTFKHFRNSGAEISSSMKNIKILKNYKQWSYKNWLFTIDSNSLHSRLVRTKPGFNITSL